MYVNDLGFRGMERVTGVHNTTIMAVVKQVGELLPDYYTQHDHTRPEEN